MKRTITGVVLAAASGLVFATVVGAGTAQAAPEDCAVTLELTGASAVCNDTDAPEGREYTVKVDCVGIYGMPYQFPFVGVGPYPGGWGGWFVPTGQGSASCISPLGAGIATGAHVAIYVE